MPAPGGGAGWARLKAARRCGQARGSSCGSQRIRRVEAGQAVVLPRGRGAFVSFQLRGEGTRALDRTCVRWQPGGPNRSSGS